MTTSQLAAHLMDRGPARTRGALGSRSAMVRGLLIVVRTKERLGTGHVEANTASGTVTITETGEGEL